MKSYLVPVSILVVVLSFTTSLLAAPPGFGICDEYSGAAKGLCRAGVAVGCAEDDSKNACMRIAEHFEEATGSPPPYAQAQISPPDVSWGEPFTITDPKGRITQSDFVIVFEVGTDPSFFHYSATDISAAMDGSSISGVAPVFNPSVPAEPDANYVFRVTSDLSTPTVEDIEVILPKACVPPDC